MSGVDTHGSTDPREDWRYFVLCFIADASYATTKCAKLQCREYGNAKHQCEECGKQYRHYSSLHRHIKYNCKSKLMCVCKHCGKVYSRPNNFTEHMIKVHADPSGNMDSVNWWCATVSLVSFAVRQVHVGRGQSFMRSVSYKEISIEILLRLFICLVTDVPSFAFREFQFVCSCVISLRYVLLCFEERNAFLFYFNLLGNDQLSSTACDTSDVMMNRMYLAEVIL